MYLEANEEQTYGSDENEREKNHPNEEAEQALAQNSATTAEFESENSKKNEEICQN